MRVREAVLRSEMSSGITCVREVYNDSPRSYLYTTNLILTDPTSVPVEWSHISDELGYRPTQRVIHAKRSLDNYSGLMTFDHSYQYGSLFIHDTVVGDALSFLAAFSPDFTKNPGVNPGLFEPVDRTRISFGTEESSKSDFFGLEFGKDLFNLILAMKKLDVRKTIKNSKSILKRFRISPSSTMRGVRSALSTTSNGFLAYQFGIKPMADDLASLGSAYSLYQLSRFRQRLANDRSDGYRKSSGAYNTVYPVTQEPEPVPGSSLGLIPLLTGKSALSAMSGKVQVKPTDVSTTFAAYLGTHLKLNDLLGLGWELIPFSFAADWFLHIDKRIAASQQFFSSQYGNPAGVKDQCLSQKRTWTEKVMLVTKQTPLWPLPDSVRQICSVVNTLYLRNVSSVEGLDLLSTAGYGSYQRQLSAALVWQKVSGMLSRR